MKLKPSKKRFSNQHSNFNSKMGSIIGACIGSMCTGICCSACKQCNGQKYGVISRIPYIFLFFVAGVFAIVMSLYGTTALDLKFYTTSICTSSTCTGNGSVYRVSFLLFIFELIHVLFIGVGVISFHWLWFILKFITFSCCLFLTFIVGDDESSNTFFQGYADYFARYVSAIYLILQILILISYSYKINEYLQEKGNEPRDRSHSVQSADSEQNGSCNIYFLGLGLATFGLYAISLTLCGFMYAWYGSDSSCTLHRTLISLTIVMNIVSGAISGIRGDGSLFVSSVVSFYVTFLCFAAMQADEDETCNIFAGYRSTASLWIGYLISFICIFYAAFKADRIGILWETNDDEYILMDNSINMDINDDDDSIKNNDNDILNDTDNIDNKSKDNNKDNNSDKKKEKEPSANVQRISNVYFHFILMLAACYFAMLFSDWGTGTDLRTTGKESMWVNIVTQYAIITLFLWTLLAPAICPSRFAKNEEEQEDV